jgi:hypothetical protein
MNRIATFLFVLISAFSIYAAEQLPDLAQTKLAAEKGDLEAQVRLADRYFSSFNVSEAVKWYRPSAEKGIPYAQYCLGEIYMIDHAAMGGGTKVPANQTEGIQWLLKAAYQGHEKAQLSLGHCYKDGNGVPKDLVESYKWYSLATKKISHVGPIYRDPLILKMSNIEIAEGQRRADNFKTGQPLGNPRPRTLRDARIEAQSRADNLKTNTPPAPPQLPPSTLANILVKGISIGKARSIAVINDTTFAPGDEAEIKVAGKSIRIKCYEIRDNSVIIGIPGTTERHEIQLR